MLIGELGRQAGVSTRTLRYYETLGLLPARRTSNGYRDFDETDLAAVREIRTLIDLGFTLDETRPFLDCLRAGNAVAGSCPDSLAVYRRKLDEVDAYLERLTRIRADLEGAVRDALAERGVPPEPRCAFSAPSTASPSHLSNDQE
jgi:DNA-binding transcriptional MerR regulator